MAKRRLAGLGLVVLSLSGCWTYFDRIVVAALSPRVPFNRLAVRTSNGYGHPSQWAELPAENAPRHAADVFYVHPTSYVGREWNAEFDDATVNQATIAGGTRIQASAFRDCCDVYAPRYRQANLTAFLRPSPDGAQAVAFAASDVAEALRFYLREYNRGRPFIIAAHSQGSVTVLPALIEQVGRTPARERLVVAYLIGGPLTEASLAETGLPACDSPSQTQCIVAFNARSADYPGGLDFVEGPATPPRASSPRLCVNPLSWRHDEALAPASLHRGAVFYNPQGVAEPVRPNFTSARCNRARGWLEVAPTGSIPRDFMSKLLAHAIGDGNFHPVEYGLFYENLRFNAAERLGAWATAHPNAPPAAAP